MLGLSLSVLYSAGSLQVCFGICPPDFCGSACAGSVWGSGLALLQEAEAVALQSAEFPWRCCLVCV